MNMKVTLLSVVQNDAPYSQLDVNRKLNNRILLMICYQNTKSI